MRQGAIAVAWALALVTASPVVAQTASDPSQVGDAGAGAPGTPSGAAAQSDTATVSGTAGAPSSVSLPPAAVESTDAGVPVTTDGGTPLATDEAPTEPGAAEPPPSPEGVTPTAKVNPPEEDAAPMRQTVVTGTRTERYADDVVVPTEVITRRDIERTGSRDLRELLAGHPGVDFEYAFGNVGVGLRLQGFDPEAVAILVDGQPISGRVRGLFDLSRFPLNEVERIEIIKGPSAALYGADAMGGVVNIITRRSTRPQEAQVTASYGPRTLTDLGGELDLRAHSSARRGPWSARLGGGRRTTPAYDLDPSDPGTTGSANSGFDVNGGVGFSPSDALALNLDVDYLWRDQYGIDSLATGAIYDRRQRAELFNTRLSGRGDVAGNTFRGGARFSLYRDQLLQDQRAGTDDAYSQSIERVWDGNFQWDRVIAERHTVSAGIDQTLFQQRATARLGPDTHLRYRTGVYAQDEWRPFASGELTVLPGLRVDVDSQFGSALSPRLAASWTVRPDLKLRAAYGWGFRAPTFQELYLFFENPAIGYRVEGNPNLGAEKSRGFTFALDHQIGDGVQVGLSLFRHDVTDLIGFVTKERASPEEPIIFTYENIRTARMQGGEASARFRVWNGGWLDLGYALTDARDVERDRLLDGRAVHRVTAQISGRVRPAQLDVNARVAWSSPRVFYYDELSNELDQPARTESSTELEARVGRRLLSWLSVFVGAKNLLNAGDPTYLPIAPRQFYGGATLELP